MKLSQIKNDPFSPAFIVQALNTAGGLYDTLLGSEKLSAKTLMQQAEQQNKLTDWGKDLRFLDPLNLLIDDANSLTELSFCGKRILAQDILNALRNRLQLQRAWTQHPEVFQRRIEAPLFIMSLPRTGTTFLLNLLCQDPAARPPSQWEMLYPTPMQTYDGPREQDPRIALAEGYSRRFYRFMPRVAKIHYMNPYAPGECRFLLQNSFVSKYYVTLLPLFKYDAWLNNCDASFAYQEYLKQLQLLDFSYTNEHWVLKAPSHTPFIREVLSVLPDARLIQVHRSPVEFVGSALSGVSSLRNCVCNTTDRQSLGREFLSDLSLRMKQYLAARKEVGWDRFCDISYAQLVADPLSTVQQIYDFFGLKFSASTQEKMSSWLAANRQHKRGVHQYQLDQFGLSETVVNAQFEEYLTHFQAYDL